MRLASLRTALSFAIAVTGCGDEAEERSFVGPVFPGDAGDARGPDAPEVKPPPEPTELEATSCPAVSGLPGRDDPRLALTALAVTETRVYAATNDAVLAFSRAGDCPGDPATSFQGGTVAVGVEPLALAARDSLGVLIGDSRGVTLRNDDPFFSRCVSLAPTRSLGLSPTTPIAFGAFVAPSVERLALGGDAACAGEAIDFAADALAIDAVAATDRLSEIAAAYTAPDASVRIARFSLEGGQATVDEAQQAAGPCSARTIGLTSRGAVVLDSSCGAVRVYDLTRGAEVGRYSLPGGQVARGLAPIVGEPRALLGSVPASGGGASFAVVDLEPL